jgi:putative ABC transport system permease protein
MATSILFGLLPAIQTSRRDVVERLKAGGRTGSSRRESWASSGLVVAEVALSLMLLVAAGLMVRSLLRVTASDYGVDTRGVLVARVPLDSRRYPSPERRAALALELVERIKRVQTVESAAINTWFHPFGNLAGAVVVPGANDDRPVTFHPITPDYPRVFRIPLRQGRLLDDTDLAARRPVAVVSELFVKRYLNGRGALGATFRAPRFSDPPYRAASDTFEIVGVIGDTMSAFRREVRPEAYVPYTLAGDAGFAVAVRAKSGDAGAMAPIVRSAIAAIDRDQPLTDIDPVDRLLARLVSAGPKFNVVLFGAFAALGLALVSVGIYGVIANAVARRTREIGVRMALGATLGDIVRLVVGQGARLIGLGLVLGLLGGLATAKYLASLLRGVSPYDAVSTVAVAALLAVVGVVASWVPALRATKIEPVGALRAE